MRNQTRLSIIGGGPRAVGLLERLSANAPLLAPDVDLVITIFDPHPVGPGRVWRYDQSASLKMNSLAEDVAMFSDPSCTLEGPIVPGPRLDEWAALVRSGEIAFTPPDPAVAAEIAGFGPQSFATRRLQSCYLRWTFERVRDALPETITVEEVRGTVLRVTEEGDRQELVYRDADGTTRTHEADLVLYTIGHTDSQRTADEQELTARSSALGLRYWPSHYAAEIDLDEILPGETVLLRGLGLSFVDLVVRLTLDRGGQVVTDPDAPIGSRVTYVPSGREPHIVAGSRRGVPYHAKITSHLHGETGGMAPVFFTRDALAALLAGPEPVDFRRDAWPLIVTEMAYWHYREIFTGHPERVNGSWEDVAAAFATSPYGSPELHAVLARSVTAADLFDIDAFDRPLAGKRFASLAALQEHVADYIRRDLTLRAEEEHSETLAIFWSLLVCFGVFAEVADHPNWTADAKHPATREWWRGFFSYVDSGPPAERLELLLALQRAGLLTFSGGESRFAIDEAARDFAVTSAQHEETIHARALIDAFHPAHTVGASEVAVLRDLIESGQGTELVIPDAHAPIPTGLLAIDPETVQIIRPDGTPHPTRYAVGDFTSEPGTGTFARPGTNARIFRANDRIARNLLHTVAHRHTVPPGIATRPSVSASSR